MTREEREALKLALEALEELNNTNSQWWQEVDRDTVDKIDPAITAIKEALAQPEQEPLGFAVMERPWVPLTDEEIDCVTIKCFGSNADLEFHRHHARATEAKLKEKNSAV